MTTNHSLCSIITWLPTNFDSEPERFTCRNLRMIYSTRSGVSANSAKQQNMHHLEARQVDYERTHLETSYLIDHCQVPLNWRTHHCFCRFWMEQQHCCRSAVQEAENIIRTISTSTTCSPSQSVVADQAFMTEACGHVYQSLDITPILLGPNTP